MDSGELLVVSDGLDHDVASGYDAMLSAMKKDLATSLTINFSDPKTYHMKSKENVKKRADKA